MPNDIRQWLEIDPLDTLFFRGSEPMVAGQNHEVRTVFPPMPSTIVGAIRTAALTQRGALREFLQHEGDGPALKDFPLLGNSRNPGFAVAGPIVEAEIADGVCETFLPVPAHWFGWESKNDDCKVVYVAKPCLPEADEIGLLSGSSLPLLVESPASSALKNLYGFWANAVAFAAVNQGVSSLTLFDDFKRVQAGKPILLRPEALFGQEQRTGIALDSTPRRVRKGHLYSSTHVRIVAGVRLLVGLSADVVPSYLDPEGILQLGGEQRLVHYKHRQKLVPLPAPMTGWAMALSPIEFGSLRMIGLLDRPRASGTLLRMAGWDMKNQFHKPTLAFLPMGTVIEIGDISSGLPFGFIAI